ncbi:MAG: hypothetical protein A2666_01380 [Parcubacteria group bacterium RIFCSPHIGHO2_01_FULL_47_10b]|nr:MAG: hypothetical protein A2666_01380 [Parcubacteria group bacterium RIFCSPHIGHO2_01_FULL_47_10b]
MTLANFIKERRYLIWYVKDTSQLSEDSVVEAVLNYGDWDDVQQLFKIVGMQKAASIFRRKSKKSAAGRQNYRPEIKHYFTQYFKQYA